jgi:hypothetical protein
MGNKIRTGFNDPNFDAYGNAVRLLNDSAYYTGAVKEKKEETPVTPEKVTLNGDNL